MLPDACRSADIWESPSNQVRQAETGARAAVRCGTPVGLTALCDEITSTLGRLGLVGTILEIEVVDRVRRDQGAAKLWRFVLLLGLSVIRKAARPVSTRPGPQPSAPPAP
jgi:hypothetical protein